MPGYKANPETIINCGGKVGGMTEQANKIKEQVTAAEVPEISWGLLGLATTYDEYRGLLEKFKKHLDEISTNLTEAGQKITEAGRHYQETDRMSADELAKVMSQGERRA